MSLQVAVETTKAKPKKYAIKPLRDLRSKFEMRLEAKQEALEHAAEEKRRKEEEERIAVRKGALRYLCCKSGCWNSPLERKSLCRKSRRGTLQKTCNRSKQLGEGNGWQ